MTGKELLQKRFSELSDDMAKIKAATPKDGWPPDEAWHAWKSSSADLLARILPAESSHRIDLKKSFQGFTGHEILAQASGVFSSAKRDFDSGYLCDFEMLVSGSVLGDFVTLAEDALGEGHVQVA